MSHGRAYKAMGTAEPQVADSQKPPGWGPLGGATAASYCVASWGEAEVPGLLNADAAAWECRWSAAPVCPVEYIMEPLRERQLPLGLLDCQLAASSWAWAHGEPVEGQQGGLLPSPSGYGEPWAGWYLGYAPAHPHLRPWSCWR